MLQHFIIITGFFLPPRAGFDLRQFGLKFASVHPDLVTHRERENTRVRQFKNWLPIKLLSPLCLAASLFQHEGDFFFYKFGSSSEESEWKRVASRLCAWCRHMKRQNRRGKRPAERGKAVFASDSGVQAHRREFPLRGSFSSFCVLRYHPTWGHGAAAFFFFCMHEEISPNPWTEHLCRGWTPHVLWGLRPDQLTEAAVRGKHLAAQRRWFLELARFDTYCITNHCSG